MLKKLAAVSTDHATTALGVIAGGEKISQVDWHALMSGDETQIGRLVVGLVFMLWGFLTNR